MPEILLTDETWARLKSRAEPLEDTPEDVIRRLLDSADKRGLRDSGAVYSVGVDRVPHERSTGTSEVLVHTAQIQNRRPARLGHGIKVPQSEFRDPILLVLERMGGSGHAKEVLATVENRMRSRLSPVDYELIPSGHQARWEKSANWERMNMVNDGLLRNDSPRGVWELSERGSAEARKLSGQGSG